MGLMSRDLQAFTDVRACLHVPSLFPCPSKSASKFNIGSMVMDRLTDRLGSEPIPSLKVNLTVDVIKKGTETVCVNLPYCLWFYNCF